MPNLPDETVVEVPAIGDAGGIHPLQMEPLPEAIAAMLRLQASIHLLLVEAFAERSKEKLPLEPTVDSDRNALQMVDEMLELQREVLPSLHYGFGQRACSAFTHCFSASQCAKILDVKSPVGEGSLCLRTRLSFVVRVSIT